jgi:predicted nucleic acid-binding protein
MEKFYLDTNILFGYFLKKILERKGIYKESKVADFLISSSKKLKYAVSILTKAEIVRKLKSEFNANKGDIEDVWRGLTIEVSPSYIQIPQSLEEIYEEIVNIVFEVPMKKRVTNLEHLIIAKKNNLIFVTGDKEIIRKCKRFYEKILDYRTLRKIYKNTNNLNSKKEG